MRYASVIMLPVLCICHSAFAQDEADLAKQLANPIAALISVPAQMNYDENFGVNDDGSMLRINVQPVIPISLNDDWNMISRTILPIVNQSDIPSPGVSEFGLGDTVQSVFFSPKAATASGWIWGAGPVFLLPTATDDVLGSEKWGFGPTVVVLTQQGPWTYGGLANHIESFAGESARADISATFLQPFMSYITPSKTTYSVNMESTTTGNVDAGRFHSTSPSINSSDSATRWSKSAVAFDIGQLLRALVRKAGESGCRSPCCIPGNWNRGTTRPSETGRDSCRSSA